MNEMNQVWLVSLRVLVLLLFSTLYALGGRMKKALFRRILGSLVLAGGTIGISLITGTFTWWFFLVFPAYFGALSLGYGGDSLGDKLGKRLMCGVALGCACFPIVFFTGLWMVGVAQVILACFAHIYFGIINPYDDAVKEEATIAMLGTALVPFLV